MNTNDKSVRVLIALDDDGRLRVIWGGANVAMASRRINDISINLRENVDEVTDIIQ